MSARSDAMLALTAARAFAAYPSAAGIFTQIAGTFHGAGISGPALRAVIAIETRYPPDRIEGVGPATRWAAHANIARRSAFFVAAAHRIQDGLAGAASRGEPRAEALDRLAETESRYFGQHFEANQGRIMAGSAIDGAAYRWGKVLGWQSVHDARTSPECKAADGRNFLAAIPPAIGYPGTVHPHCRCHPVAPFRGAPLLPTLVRLAA
jgi:hypothetical protein